MPKIAQEMVAMGYSNEEDIYIQKYEDNKKLDEIEYVHSENTTIEERFSIEPMGMEAGKTLDSINEMLSMEDNQQEVETLKRDDAEIIYKSEPTFGTLSSLREKYNSILDNISNLFKSEKVNPSNHLKLDSFKIKPSIMKNCTLTKNNETNSILSKIRKLKEEMNRN
jgi:hypothetical protein